MNRIYYMRPKIAFKFKNFGYIKEGNIELADLTIICGKNNVGKTYINYGIYGFLDSILSNLHFSIDKKYFDELREKGFVKIPLIQFEEQIKPILNKGCKEYAKNLDKIFAADSDFFKDVIFQANFEGHKIDYSSEEKASLKSKNTEIAKIVKQKDSKDLEIKLLDTDYKEVPGFVLRDMIDNVLGKIFLGKAIPKPFVITSERTGVSLFYKELDFTRTNIINYLTKTKNKKNFNPFDFLDEFVAKYPITIKHNINLVRTLSDAKKSTSELWSNETIKKELQPLWNQIILGDFKSKNDELYYIQSGSKNKMQIPLHLSSSSIKALILLDTYIKHIAKKGDLLIIDEPELNLHPNLQILIAQMLARLVNSGVKILLTTHSDYILKEINNLIMLSKDFNEKEQFMKKYKYIKRDILSKDKVKVFVNQENTIKTVDIGDFGLHFESLDDFICNLNDKSNLISNYIQCD